MIEEEPAYQYPATPPPEPTPTPLAPPGDTARERFSAIRRLVVFILGCAIIIDALWDRSYVVPELIVGMIMVGVLPIDEFITGISKRRRRGG